MGVKGMTVTELMRIRTGETAGTASRCLGTGYLRRDRVATSSTQSP
jgi:hypothetical protein